MEEMNDKIAIEWWMDHLAGLLAPEQEEQLHAYLGDRPGLREELQIQQSMWEQLASFEEVQPSPAMDAKFDAALGGYLAASTVHGGLSITLPSWLQLNWRMGLAFTMLGVLVGYLVIPQQQPNGEISQLSQEVMEMKRMMMLTLIEQPRAQERIKAVSMAREFDGADEKVIEVLGTTLRSDNNVNVRLAAIESLLKYWDYPQARQVLVKSISQQESPLVQVAIADAMLSLREKEAIYEFEKLIDDKELNEAVKDKIETTIDQLKSI